MKNFKIVFVLVFVLLSFSNVLAQREALVQLSDQMFEKTNERDFDALLDMTYPKIYDIVPKETMKNLFVSMFQGTEEVTIDIPKMTPKYILSENFKDDKSNTNFAFLTYDMQMTMTFKTQEFDDDSKEMMVKMMKAQGMDASFESNSKANVNAPDRMVIFISDELTNNEWKLLNYDPTSPIFSQLLPIDILEKAKNYHQNILLESKKK